MTIALRERGVAVLLLDIEGTTTPIAFVHDSLFPYARARLAAYLEDPAHVSDAAEILSGLADERRADEAGGAHPPELAIPYLEWLMDRDRKSPALKRLQGLIWEEGYRRRELTGEIFADVAPAIRRWRAAGHEVAIYSSGSVLAQRLLFGTTPNGDLTALLSAFFDTAVGMKTSADSYRAIVRALGHAPEAVLFVSDVTSELRAAKAAGLQVVLSIRPGNPSQPGATDFDVVLSFDELV